MATYAFIAIAGIVLGFVVAHVLYTADAFAINAVCSRCIKKRDLCRGCRYNKE